MVGPERGGRRPPLRTGANGGREGAASDAEALVLGAAAAQLDVGCVRAEQEDAVMVAPELALVALADGSGGAWPAELALGGLRGYGERLGALGATVSAHRDSASRLAVGAFIGEVMNELGRSIAAERVRRASTTANSTLVLLTLLGAYAYVAHTGDSRAYLFRNGELRTLTAEHTVAMEQLRRGDISLEEYAVSRFRKTLTQALGVTPEVRPDIAEVRVVPGDLFLLCSDGLYRMVPDEAIEAIVTRPGTLAERADALVAAARAQGGRDNVSVILVPVEAERGGEVAAAGGASVDIPAVLERCALFEALSHAELVRLTPYFEELVVPGGAVVCREGEPGDSLYVLVSGKLNVSFKKMHLMEIEPGGWAGEVALVRAGTRTATLTAMEPSVLLALSRERFVELVRRRPSLGVRLGRPLLGFVGARVAALQARLAEVEGLVRAVERRG